MAEFVTLEVDGAVATIRLDRPPMNALNAQVQDEIAAVEERAFTLEEAYAAREAFETSASQIVMPVVSIDGRIVGNGRPGLLTEALRREYHRFAEAG